MGITATYSDADTFTVAGDLTTELAVGRRIRANCGVDGYKYGTVLSVSYSSPNTTVNLTADSDDLTANLTEILYGIVSQGSSGSMPDHDHAGAEGDGGIVDTYNAIINGDFTVAQRGTSFASPSSGDWTLDRWIWYDNSAGAVTITQDTDVPTFAQSGHHSVNSLKIDVTTADAAVAADALVTKTYLMEGYDFQMLEGRKCTLSFWIKSVKTGTMCVSFQNSAKDQSYIAEITISAASTWEKKTITLDFDSGGTFLYTTAIGLYINFAIHVGSNYEGTVDTWNATNDIITSNQDNFLDDALNNVWLSQVKLEIGPAASVYQARQITEKMARCQRYYTLWAQESRWAGYCRDATHADFNVDLPVKMRTTPTADYGTATNWVVRRGTGTEAATVMEIVVGNSQLLTMRATVASGLTAGQGCMVHADVATSYLALDAELA